MEVKEALELLPEIMMASCLSANSLERAEAYNEALLLAKKALEKQLPIKTLIDTVDPFDWAICKSCGGSISMRNIREHIYIEEVTYCEHCGQAIDWSADNG